MDSLASKYVLAFGQSKSECFRFPWGVPDSSPPKHDKKIQKQGLIVSIFFLVWLKQQVLL